MELRAENLRNLQAQGAFRPAIFSKKSETIELINFFTSSVRTAFVC